MNPLYSWMNEIQYGGDPRKQCQAPFKYQLDGTEWLIATNGHMLCAVKQTSDAELIKHVTIDTILQCNEAGYQASMEALRNWVGEDSLKPCSACERTGYVQCNCNGDEKCTKQHMDDTGEVECEQCDGVGLTGFEHRLGRIGGILINRILIAKALHRLQAETVDVFMGPKQRSFGEFIPVIFAAQDWRIAVMPIDYAALVDHPNEVVEFTAWNKVTA